MAPGDQPQPVSNHQPVLVACVARASQNADGTNRVVLELGCGHYSTPLLHGMCAVLGLTLVTMESDRDWLARFKHLDDGGGHVVLHVGNWRDVRPMLRQPNALVFLDHRPYEARGAALRDCGNSCLIVAHDTQEARRHAYQYDFTPFKHRYDYTRYTPATTVVSNTDDLAWLEDLRL